MIRIIQCPYQMTGTTGLYSTCSLVENSPGRITSYLFGSELWPTLSSLFLGKSVKNKTLLLLSWPIEHATCCNETCKTDSIKVW